ncbi:MAG TPA: DNA recombination protein RmuC [Candidatus Woesebacteria bacterium]|nr:DNA recombination protein RmuC [Candidatus Woesebacteria bacterium]
MSADTIIVIAFLFFGLLVLYFLLKSQLQKPQTDPTLTAWLKSLQQSFDTTNKNTTLSLQQNYRELFSRLDQATSIIGDLKKEAGAFSEVSRSMKDLQDYLKSPKLRGNIGEQVLKDLLGQMFPKTGYLLQHHFKSGQIVDAAIKTQAGLLPIDSKFPMENFQKIYQATTQTEKVSSKSAFIRDVKRHLKDISDKYILPEEGTLDFALMYIPSESIYYEIVNEEDILSLARDLRVYPVSPTTLYAHLQTILLSLEGQKIAGKTSEVFTLLRAVQKDYEKLDENFALLGKHLTNAYNTLNDTSHTMNQIGSKLDSAKSLKSGLEAEK